MGDDLRRQIYLNFNQRQTEELIDIWRVYDSNQWSETTFDVIRQILEERHVELPPEPDMTPDAITYEKHPVLWSMVFAGIAVSFLAFFLILVAYPNWTELATFLRIMLALLVGYWLAAIYSFLLSNSSKLRARTPKFVRNGVRWFVIAVSFLLSGAMVLAYVVLWVMTRAAAADD